MEAIEGFVNSLNGILFSNYTVYALLAVGLLFTIWSGFGQYRARTHGVAVGRGKFDDKHDPGAITHFQALSAARSATVGRGNIAKFDATKRGQHGIPCLNRSRIPIKPSVAIQRLRSCRGCIRQRT